MNALGMATLMAHWESERQRFMRKAHEAATAGRPALQHLRTASQCEARVDKLVRLTNKAAQPKSAAVEIDRGVYRTSVKAQPRSAA